MSDQRADIRFQLHLRHAPAASLALLTSHPMNELAIKMPAAQRPAHQPPRALEMRLKNPAISRAKRSAAWAGWAALKITAHQRALIIVC
jgi:hypothetical protein